MSTPADHQHPAAGADIKELVERPMSFAQTIKAVAWSFLGVRKQAGYQQDIQKLNPVHVIVAGLIGAAIFIATLIIIVNAVVGG